MVRIRLFVVASPAGRKKPPHAVGRWPSVSDGRWGFARFPQHARLRVSCGPGMPGPYGRWPGVEIRAAFAEARATKGMPTAIIAKTLKGKGVSFMENAVDWHGKAPNDDEYKIAMEDLEKAGAALCQN